VVCRKAVLYFARAVRYAVFRADSLVGCGIEKRAAYGSRLMRIKQRDVYTSRYYRHGNSWGMIIPPDIRDLMGLVPGDSLALNFQHGVLWAVKITPGMITTRAKVAKIFDELFPDKENTVASE